MPDVLRAVEHPERQPGQEVPGGEVPGHGADLEPAAGPEEVVHVFKLRDLVGPTRKKRMDFKVQRQFF